MGNRYGHGNLHDRRGRFEERSRTDAEGDLRPASVDAEGDLRPASVDAERIGMFLARDRRALPRPGTAPLEVDELAQPGIAVLQRGSARHSRSRRALRSAHRVARVAWRSLRKLRRLLRRLG